MIGEMFSVIGEAITSFASSLASAFTAITTLFYTPGVDNAPGEFTFLGTLALIGVGVGLVYLAYRVIRKLISLKMG